MANALRQAAARLPTVGQGGLAMTTSANTHMQPANIVRPIKINRRSVSNSGAPRRGSIDGDGAQLSSAFPQVKRGAGEPLTPRKDPPAARLDTSECTHRVSFSGVNNERVSISRSK